MYASAVAAMQITIIGAGAMGSLFGGLLHHAGNAVTLVDVRAEHVAALRRRDLVIEEAEWRETVGAGARDHRCRQCALRRSLHALRQDALHRDCACAPSPGACPRTRWSSRCKTVSAMMTPSSARSASGCRWFSASRRMALRRSARTRSAIAPAGPTIIGLPRRSANTGIGSGRHAVH